MTSCRVVGGLYMIVASSSFRADAEFQDHGIVVLENSSTLIHDNSLV